jgi:hypothetical protein
MTEHKEKLFSSKYRKRQFSTLSTQDENWDIADANTSSLSKFKEQKKHDNPLSTIETNKLMWDNDKERPDCIINAFNSRSGRKLTENQSNVSFTDFIY